MTTPSSRVPIHYRLRNPPAVFVGRDDELRWFQTAVARGPVAVVWGVGGIGKTAFVRAGCHRFLPDALDSTIAVTFSEEALTEPLHELLRAIGAAARTVHLDWRALPGAPEELAEVVFELAESAGLCVVIDDAHRASASGLNHLLVAAARYARSSRWIVTSRAPIALPESPEQVLPLRPLGDAAIRELASELTPGSEQGLGALVARAAGSPLRVRQLAAGRDPERVLSDPSSDSSSDDLLAILALVDAPLSPEELARAGVVVDEDLLRGLEARGVLEWVGAGVRMHDLVRAIARVELDASRAHDLAPRLARVLELSPRAASLVDAFRLYVASGLHDKALAVVTRDLSTIVEAGFATPLCAGLSRISGPRAALLRMRTALASGDMALLNDVSEPTDAPLEDRALWAQVLFARGEAERAETCAAHVRDEASRVGQGDLVEEMVLVMASLRNVANDPPGACALLDGFEPREPLRRARRDTLMASQRASLGDFEGALHCVERVTGHMAEFGWRDRLDLARGLVETLTRCGRIRDAASLFDAHVCSLLGGSGALSGGTDISMAAFLAVHRGEPSLAISLLERLRRHARRGSFYLLYERVLRVRFRMSTGDYHGLSEQLEETLRDAIAAPSSFLVASCLLYRAMLARAAGESRCDLSWPIAGERPPLMVMYWVYVARAYVSSAGGEDAIEMLAPPEATPVRHARVITWNAIVFTQRAIVARDGAAALRYARSAVSAARDGGFRCDEADALLVSADAALVSGDDSLFELTISQLASLGALSDSPRLCAERRFLRAVRARPLFEELEQVALLAEVAPIAAMRARALLGSAQRLTPLDDRVLTAIRERWSGGRQIARRELDAGRWRAGWGFDAVEGIAWLPDGRSVSFASTPLLARILEVLARSGRASKEVLVRTAWKPSTYRPLRDDKRLQVAIRKLRTLLEDEPSSPPRIVTTDDGYALGDAIPFTLRHARGRGRADRAPVVPSAPAEAAARGERSVTVEESSPVLPGQLLGAYEILGLVSRGGMGEIWLARREGGAELVAMKTLLPTLADDPKMRLMFIEETRIASRLVHPNVVQVLEVGEPEPTPYYVMEWVDGASVDDLFTASAKLGGRLALPILLEIIVGAARGLQAAHELRDDNGQPLDVVHRDVSPSNLLVGRDGVAKITDFGIARARDRIAKTTTGGFRGKLSYVAPEQALGSEVDGRVDVWGLGAVLYEGLSGHPPYEGTDEVAILAKLLTGPPPLVLPADVPRQLSPVLRRAMAHARAARYATAGELASALDAVRNQLGLVATSADVAAEVERMLGAMIDARRDRILRGSDKIGRSPPRSSALRRLPPEGEAVALVPGPASPRARSRHADRARRSRRG